MESKYMLLLFMKIVSKIMALFRVPAFIPFFFSRSNLCVYNFFNLHLHSVFILANFLTDL